MTVTDCDCDDCELPLKRGGGGSGYWSESRNQTMLCFIVNCCPPVQDYRYRRCRRLPVSAHDELVSLHGRGCTILVSRTLSPLDLCVLLGDERSLAMVQMMKEAGELDAAMSRLREF